MFTKQHNKEQERLAKSASPLQKMSWVRTATPWLTSLFAIPFSCCSTSNGPKFLHLCHRKEKACSSQPPHELHLLCHQFPQKADRRGIGQWGKPCPTQPRVARAQRPSQGCPCWPLHIWLWTPTPKQQPMQKQQASDKITSVPLRWVPALGAVLPVAGGEGSRSCSLWQHHGV